MASPSVSGAAGSSGSAASIDMRSNDFICPICLDLIQEASVARCGHTFCLQCILMSVTRFNRCPKCNIVVTNDEIFPNRLLDGLIARYKLKVRLQEASTGKANLDGLKSILTNESQKLSLPDINQMLRVLNERKQALESESNAVQNCLLYEFLKQLLKQKEESQIQIAKEIVVLRRDLEMTENMLKSTPAVPIESPAITKPESMDTSNLHEPQTTNAAEKQPSPTAATENVTSFEAHLDTNIKNNLLMRRNRMYTHFDDFASLYFTTRRRELAPRPTDNEQMNIDQHVKSVPFPAQNLDEFRDNLVKFSRYSSFRPLATMKYSTDVTTNSTIVSTIEFDKDNEFFAIGGVTKRIKVYDYYTVLNDEVDMHYPCVEMVSSSKISCITWNHQHKNILASCDYEGSVNIWDANTGQFGKSFHEHERRCWSVDFNEVDTNLIVSGSDDSKVKIWSLKDDHSIASLEAKANVCCVKFNPNSSCHFAFGSADHDVHYYDLRNLSKAVCVFRGHKKAVSYVKFLNSHELISASTDSQLKLWNVNRVPSTQCMRTYTGHVNEKNFIGLATDRDYIACGSEDNSVFLYYKGLPKQLFSYKIDSNRDRTKTSDVSDFISAVCYRKQCNVVLAANSRGLIKILELV